jgi:hypothetical protein
MTHLEMLAILKPAKREPTALLVYDIRDARRDRTISLASADALCKQGRLDELLDVCSGATRYFFLPD